MTMPPMVYAGMQALENIALELGLSDKIYGPLHSLITPLDDSYITAIEAAASAQLMHVVVDTADTASRLMEELQRKRLGRVTFKPLNVLLQKKMRSVGEVLEEGEDQAVGLMSVVDFDPRVSVAVKSALGGTLLCQSDSVASEYSRKYGVNCVTTQGDVVNARGALSGGFHDSRRSKLSASRAYAQAKAKKAELMVVGEEARRQAQEQEQDVTRMKGELDKLEAEGTRLRRTRATLIQERKRVRVHLAQAQADRVNAPPVASTQDLEAQLARLTSELASDMQVDLSLEEAQEVKRLHVEVAAKRVKEQEAELAMEGAKAKVKELEHEISNHLVKRIGELEVLLEEDVGVVSLTQATDEELQESVSNALQVAKQELAQVQAQLGMLGIGLDLGLVVLRVYISVL